MFFRIYIHTVFFMYVKNIFLTILKDVLRFKCFVIIMIIILIKKIIIEKFYIKTKNNSDIFLIQ
jgi:hypothetical protein